MTTKSPEQILKLFALVVATPIRSRSTLHNSLMLEFLLMRALASASGTVVSFKNAKNSDFDADMSESLPGCTAVEAFETPRVPMKFNLFRE